MNDRVSTFVLLILAFAVLIFSVSMAFADSATLEWDPNSEEDLAGYRAFCRLAGESYDYENPSWEGTETTCTILELADGAIYYFVLRAFDTSGNESVDSNQIDNDPPSGPCLLRWVR